MEPDSENIFKDNVIFPSSSSDFETMLESNQIFIDKTLFLKEIIERTCPKVFIFKFLINAY